MLLHPNHRFLVAFLVPPFAQFEPLPRSCKEGHNTLIKRIFVCLMLSSMGGETGNWPHGAPR